MARPKIHEDAKARKASYLAGRDRFDLTTNKVVGDSIRELAAMYGATNNEVINDLLRYALTNRNWKQSGLLWSAHKSA